MYTIHVLVCCRRTDSVYVISLSCILSLRIFQVIRTGLSVITIYRLHPTNNSILCAVIVHVCMYKNMYSVDISAETMYAIIYF